MKYYEYDQNGWLIGWHEEANRPNSTPLDFRPIPPRRARFVNGAWTEDGTQEVDDEQRETARRNTLLAAKQALKNFDRNTATAQQTRDAVAALIVLFRELIDSP